MHKLLTCWWVISISALPIACSPGPEDLFQDGRVAMKSLENPTVDSAVVSKGIASLLAFKDRYPNDGRLDSVLFMLASLHGVLGRRGDAAQTFLQVVDTFRASVLRANSLILAGHIYEEMQQYDKSKACLERLIREYPEHDFVVNGSAKALIDHMGQPVEEWPIPFESDSAKAAKGPRGVKSTI